MKKIIVTLILFSAVSYAQAFTNHNSITISGELNSPTPISGVRVWIRSGGPSGAVVGTASEVALIPDAGGFFSTQTYINDPGPWVFQTGSDYVVQLTSSTNEIISTFSITAIPFALTVRGDAQTGNQNVFGAYGNVGVGTTTPSYRLHITSAAGTGGDMLVVSTGASNVIRMTGAGEIYASKYYGDISGATGLPAGDNLGNHTATTNLLMGGKQIINASSITATETITASTYQISGINILISPGSSLALGKSAGGNGYGANVFIGPSAGAGNFHGFSNTFMGYESGKMLDSGDGNTGIGQNAGYKIGNGASNTYIGVNTGMKAVNGYDDTCVGAFSCSNVDVARGNTVLGSRAGESLTTGSYNVFLGKYAARNKLSGDSNIVIGVDQDLSSPSASNELNIGGVIFGNLAAKTVGISTRTPRAALDVVSTGTASNIYAQIWRASDASIQSSMSASGVMMANKFIGDGSGLTGVIASGAVQKTGDMMTGQLTLSGSTLTVAGKDASGYSLSLSSGINLPAGTVTAGLFNGSGALLTALNASNLASGTVADGRLSSNVDLLNASQTITGPKTFTSTVVLPTRDNITFGNELHNSSSTLLNGGAVTQTTFGTCVLNSSVTIVTSGNSRVMVGLAGAARQSIVGSANFFSYKINNVSIYGNTTGIINITTPSNNYDFNASFTHITDVLAAGAHEFCLLYRVSAGTGTIQSGGGYAAIPQFWVQELR